MTLHQLISYNHIDKGSDKQCEHEKKVKRDAHRVGTYMKTDATDVRSLPRRQSFCYSCT